MKDIANLEWAGRIQGSTVVFVNARGTRQRLKTPIGTTRWYPSCKICCAFGVRSGTICYCRLREKDHCYIAVAHLILILIIPGADAHRNTQSGGGQRSHLLSQTCMFSTWQLQFTVSNGWYSESLSAGRTNDVPPAYLDQKNAEVLLSVQADMQKPYFNQVYIVSFLPFQVESLTWNYQMQTRVHFATKYKSKRVYMFLYPKLLILPTSLSLAWMMGSRAWSRSALSQTLQQQTGEYQQCCQRSPWWLHTSALQPYPG